MYVFLDFNTYYGILFGKLEPPSLPARLLCILNCEFKIESVIEVVRFERSYRSTGYVRPSGILLPYFLSNLLYCITLSTYTPVDLV